MEFYLSEADQDMLGRALHDLEVLCPRLDDLMVPSTPASGTNAGLRVKKRGSRPPVVLHVLDVKLDVGLVLARWSCRTVVTLGRAGCEPPTSNDLAERAAWLHSHLLDIAAQSWAPECADAVLQAARWVVDLVDPPEPAHAPPPGDAPPPLDEGPPPPAVDAPTPCIEAPAPTAPAARPPRHVPAAVPAPPAGESRPLRMECGTARKVADAARLLGEPVSHETIRKWARAGHVRSELQADGSRLYWLADVLEYARDWRRRLAEAAST